MNTLGFGLDHIVDFRRSDDTQFLPHNQVGSVELRQTDTLGFCLDRERTPGRKHHGIGRTPWAFVWIANEHQVGSMMGSDEHPGLLSGSNQVGSVELRGSPRRLQSQVGSVELRRMNT